MATTTKTWAWPTALDSWAFTRDAALYWTGALDASVGNPVDSLKANVSTSDNSKTAIAYWSLSDTWAAIFGIPTGATVTQVRIYGIDTRNVTRTNVTSNAFGDSQTPTNGLYCDALDSGTELWAGRVPVAAEGTWTSTSAGSNVAVAAAKQAATTTVAFRLYVRGQWGTANPVIQMNWDNLVIEITYSPPATPLVIDDAGHAHAADGPVSLTEHNVLAIADAGHVHAAEGPVSLTQHNVLAIADGDHSHAAEEPLLVYHGPSTPIVIQDGHHAHAADGPVSLTQHNILAIVDAGHAHAAESPGLTQHNLLAIAEAAHAHAAETSALMQHNILAIADAGHAHAAESPALTQHSILAIADAGHGHAADNLTLTVHGAGAALVIQDAIHAHAAESPALVQHNVLAIADGSHGHAADALGLVQHNLLAIADSIHAHGAEGVILVLSDPPAIGALAGSASVRPLADGELSTRPVLSGTVQVRPLAAGEVTLWPLAS